MHVQLGMTNKHFSIVQTLTKREESVLCFLSQPNGFKNAESDTHDVFLTVFPELLKQ